MEFAIRPYKESDSEQIKKLILELKLYEGQFDPDYRTDWDSVKDLFKILQGDREKGGEIFVAENKGNIIGFIALALQKKNSALVEKDKGVVYISELCVMQDYRGKGIGGDLLDEATEFAKAKGIGLLKLSTFFDNKIAREMYERRGFRHYVTVMLKDIS
jgi:ribosomal protein S18 acetylase RimI-like enzyme